MLSYQPEGGLLCVFTALSSVTLLLCASQIKKSVCFYLFLSAEYGNIEFLGSFSVTFVQDTPGVGTAQLCLQRKRFTSNAMLSSLLCVRNCNVNAV